MGLLGGRKNGAAGPYILSRETCCATALAPKFPFLHDTALMPVRASPERVWSGPVPCLVSCDKILARKILAHVAKECFFFCTRRLQIPFLHGVKASKVSVFLDLLTVIRKVLLISMYFTDLWSS